MTLQYLVITGGTCKVQSGGVWIKDCSPTLRNCTISGSTSVIGDAASKNTFGGGLQLANNDSLIENCLIVAKS